MTRYEIEHPFAVRHRWLKFGEIGSQHALLIAVVPAFDIGESSGLWEFAPAIDGSAVRHRPAGEGARGFVDVFVDITGWMALKRPGHIAPAIIFVVEIGLTPKRVQFEEFTAVVLVC